MMGHVTSSSILKLLYISDGTQAIYTSDDFFKTDTTIIDTAANQFAVIDEFYFYVKNVNFSLISVKIENYLG